MFTRRKIRKKLAILLAAVAITAGSFLGVAESSHCTVIVAAAASIQAAIDANPGGVVCLSTGTYSQSVIFDLADSFIRLTADDGATPVMDGTGLADAGTTLDPNFGIRLLDGVRNVTIDNLEIRGYPGSGGSGQGNAIEAWDVSTRNITVRRNSLHDNKWNGVLVGSEGAFMHRRWRVVHNIVTDNDFVGIELTNCEQCQIRNNSVHDNAFHGIFIQARNTTGTGVIPIVRDARVDRNDVSGTTDSAAIRFLAYEGTTGPPFSSIGASATITNSNVGNNDVHDNSNDGIRLQGFNSGTVDRVEVTNNRAITNAGSGVELANADMSRVLGNRATGNGADGFLATSASIDNVFRGNRSEANTGFGYKDDAVTGANTYINNQCNFNSAGGSLPSGLCTPQP